MRQFKKHVGGYPDFANPWFWGTQILPILHFGGPRFCQSLVLGDPDSANPWKVVPRFSW